MLDRLLDAIPTPEPVDNPRRLASAKGGALRALAEPILDAWIDEPAANLKVPLAFRAAKAMGAADRRLARAVVYGAARHKAWLRHLRQGKLWDAALEAFFERDLREELRARPPADPLATVGSLPGWLARRIEAEVEDAAGLVVALQGRAPLTLRCRDPQRVARELGLPTSPGRHSPWALHVLAAANIEDTPLFRQGAFEIQDEGSQRVAALLEVKPGEAALDWCAGAGGKSLALAALGARVQAWDPRPKALEEAQKRAHRAGLQLRVAAPDRRVPAVMVDVPCSGSGTLRRDPFLRNRLGAEPAELPALQLRILEEAAAFCTDRLVYATCSFLRAEDEGVVAAFLERNRGWTLEVEERWWPHLHGTDAFYAARLRRA